MGGGSGMQCRVKTFVDTPEEGRKAETLCVYNIYIFLLILQLHFISGHNWKIPTVVYS